MEVSKPNNNKLELLIYSPKLTNYFRLNVFGKYLFFSLGKGDLLVKNLLERIVFSKDFPKTVLTCGWPFRFHGIVFELKKILAS